MNLLCVLVLMLVVFHQILAAPIGSNDGNTDDIRQIKQSQLYQQADSALKYVKNNPQMYAQKRSIANSYNAEVESKAKPNVTIPSNLKQKSIIPKSREEETRRASKKSWTPFGPVTPSCCTPCLNPCPIPPCYNCFGQPCNSCGTPVIDGNQLGSFAPCTAGSVENCYTSTRQVPSPTPTPSSRISKPCTTEGECQTGRSLNEYGYRKSRRLVKGKWRKLRRSGKRNRRKYGRYGKGIITSSIGINYYINQRCILRTKKSFLIGKIIQFRNGGVRISAGGKVRYVGRSWMKNLTPDQVPQACKMLRNMKILVIISRNKYMAGKIRGFWYKVRFDKGGIKWVKGSTVRVMEQTTCDHKRNKAVVAGNVLLREQSNGGYWIQGSVIKRRRQKYQIRVKGTGQTVITTNKGNMLIPNKSPNPRSLLYGQRVVVNIRGGRPYYQYYYPATVIDFGYDVLLTTGAKLKVTLRRLRVLPSQPWYIRRRIMRIRRPRKGRGISTIKRGQKTVCRIGRKSYRLKVIQERKSTRSRKKIVVFKMRLPKPKSGPSSTIHRRQKVLVWTRKSFQYGRVIKTSTSYTYIKTKTGILKRRRTQRNAVIPNTRVHKTWLFKNVRVAARSGRKGPFYPGIVRTIRRGKALVRWSTGKSRWIKFRSIRVFPKQPRNLKLPRTTGVVRKLTKKKKTWVRIRGKKYRAKVTKISANGRYAIFKTITKTRAKPTGCWGYVKRKLKGLAVRKVASRVWGYYGCHSLQGRVLKNTRSVTGFGSFHNVVILFKIKGRLKFRRNQYIIMKIKGVNYSGRVINSRANQWFRVMFNVPGISRKTRRKFSTLKRKYVRRVRKFKKRGFRLWVKVNGRRYPSRYRIHYKPKLRKRIITYRILRGKLRRGARISPRIGRRRLTGKVSTIKGRYAIVKVKVQRRIVKNVYRKKQRFIKKKVFRKITRRVPSIPLVRKRPGHKGFINSGYNIRKRTTVFARIRTGIYRKGRVVSITRNWTKVKFGRNKYRRYRTKDRRGLVTVRRPRNRRVLVRGVWVVAYDSRTRRYEKAVIMKSYRTTVRIKFVSGYSSTIRSRSVSIFKYQPRSARLRKVVGYKVRRVARRGSKKKIHLQKQTKDNQTETKVS